MTKTEAIDILTSVIAISSKEEHEAITLAVAALSGAQAMRCDDCPHNNNCNIQYAIQSALAAAENFKCWKVRTSNE